MMLQAEVDHIDDITDHLGETITYDLIAEIYGVDHSKIAEIHDRGDDSPSDR